MLLGDDIIIDNTKLCKKYFEYCKYNLLFLEEKIKIIISKKCELMVLRSSYKDKIKDLRSNAQETQAAIKIQDKLNELKSKDVIISSYRWIWELIQNAKDCLNSSGKINIDIKFDATQKIVEFKHNGKLFSTKNIVYLIEQVSTKERSRNSVSIGKFGTGFLTTNLLSSMVTISGLLHDDEDSEIAKFEVTIDRSGESIDELKKSIKNSCDQLEANTFNIAHNINENEMNTVFTYRLDDNGVKVAEIGLENFEITAPYVFAFVTELNKITINSNSEISEYTRTNGGITKNINAFVSRIHKSGFDKTINIFTIKDDTIMLATEINQLPDGNHIARYNEKLPKLFCDFPLLGTNDFSFPVVINSRRFDPTEPRNGIFLYGGNSEHNKKILGDACSLYTLMIDYFIQNDYKDIYNVVHLPPIENKDWVDKEWYNDEIISLLKNKICKFSMFQMLDDSIKAMQDDWGCKDNVFLLSDDNTKIREEVWKLSSQLFPSKHLYYEEIDKWYFSLWTECKNYGIIDLIKKVEQIGSISKLQDKIKNAIDWLNSLYKLIYEKCLENPEVSNRDNKIFPNQHGDFCCINSLKKDIGIDEAYLNPQSSLQKTIG